MKRKKKEIGMLKLVHRLVVVVLVGAIASGIALAKVIKKEVTFSQAVVVNGTTVKTGTYEVVFDDQTNELSIVKGNKVVARTPAKLEQRADRARAFYVTREEEGDSSKLVLLSVALRDATIVNGDKDSAAGSQ
jgi:hypothetical protein